MKNEVISSSNSKIVVCDPIRNWKGEVAKVADVASEKGYSSATIRKYCKDGTLDYVKVGRLYCVALNEKYEALPKTEKAQLRDMVRELQIENAQLKKQVDEMQLNFNFLSEEKFEAKTQFEKGLLTGFSLIMRESDSVAHVIGKVLDEYGYDDLKESFKSIDDFDKETFDLVNYNFRFCECNSDVCEEVYSYEYCEPTCETRHKRIIEKKRIDREERQRAFEQRAKELA